jgi:hypothetical protein
MFDAAMGILWCVILTEQVLELCVLDFGSTFALFLGLGMYIFLLFM